MSSRRVTAAALVVLAAAAAGCDSGSPGSHGAAAPPSTTAPATGSTGAPGGTGATTPAARGTGGTSPGTRPGAAGSGTAAKTRCADSPPAVVARALGLAVGPVVATDEGPVTVCAYTGRYEVLVRYQTGENASQFALDRQSAVRLRQSVTTIAGLGNEAFFAASPPSYTLAARNHGTAIFITAPAALRSERILMVQLLEKT